MEPPISFFSFETENTKKYWNINCSGVTKVKKITKNRMYFLKFVLASVALANVATSFVTNPSAVRSGAFGHR